MKHYSVVAKVTEQLNSISLGLIVMTHCYCFYQVRELLWNTDSTVLAVWCEDLVQEGSEVTPKSYSK